MDPIGYFLISIIFGCAVFGGIHIAAWNFHFPANADLILWRVASIYCASFSLIGLLALYAEDVFVKFFHMMLETDQKLSKGCSGALALLYCLGRLILLVEVLPTLFFLPPNVFMATFASNIPHVS